MQFRVFYFLLVFFIHEVHQIVFYKEECQGSVKLLFIAVFQYTDKWKRITVPRNLGSRNSSLFAYAVGSTESNIIFTR